MYCRKRAFARAHPWRQPSASVGMHSGCAGLTRAFHHSRSILAKRMDCRVKPANDGWWRESFLENRRSPEQETASFKAINGLHQLRAVTEGGIIRFRPQSVRNILFHADLVPRRRASARRKAAASGLPDFQIKERVEIACRRDSDARQEHSVGDQLLPTAPPSTRTGKGEPKSTQICSAASRLAGGTEQPIVRPKVSTSSTTEGRAELIW